MGQIADLVIPAARMPLIYMDRLCKDIPADKFGLEPQGIDCNSPAFNIGHLALYADMTIALLGKPERAKNDPKWEELFAMGIESRPDPDSSIYGSKDTLLARFADRHNEAIRAFAEASPELLAQTNPRERMREMFPTLGAMAVGMLTGHPASHLGQISTWRRCMGMPRLF